MTHREPGKALLIIDMLNTLEFPKGRQLLIQARPVAHAIARLKMRFKKKRNPVIYVNDNFGRWTSSWKQVYDICADSKCLGSELARTLKPEDDDYFVLKPKHSGFYSTTLEVLLDQLKIRSLVLTGIAGNICVFFTANDAHMRDFKVTVPKDCVASNTPSDNEHTLRQLREVFGMKTPLSKGVRA